MDPIQSLPGTEDILPTCQSVGGDLKVAHIHTWQRVEEVARELFRRAAYREIRTPCFEQTSLFERGIGTATDVVSKEMYSFRDRSDRSCTLRPEGTAGAVRAYIQHSLYAQGGYNDFGTVALCFATSGPKRDVSVSFTRLG
jgi:histidyl-tRNA synthetase